MKKFFTLFLLAMVISSLNAQAPEAFKFQTVIRNADGEVMTNQDVTLKFLLHQDEPEGDVVYEEQHITTTNPMGLVSLNIGAGEVISGDFSQIMWGEHPYFLEEQIDIGNTGDFQTFGTVQMLSVPYALHANTAGNGILSMTTVQRDSLENPAVGMQIYNTTTNCLNYWNGTNWFETCGECTPQPDDANAGPNQEYTDSTTVAQMQANTPDPGEGTWEKISYYPGYFEDMNDPNTKFHGEPCKEYYLKWIISTSCSSDSDYVKVTFNNTPSDAIAGNDTTINTETTTIGLNATQPENGEGQWNVVSGEGGSFADDTNPTSTFTGLDCTAYELAWTVATECSENTDTVNIEFYAIPTAANAGQDITINDDNLTINLGANTAEVGTGTWSIFSGEGGEFENENDPNTAFTAEPCQTYELVWTIATACESSSDTMVVDFFTIPTQADAGDDQLGLEGTWTNLEANTPEIGSGQWTILSGEGGQITNPESPTSVFLGQDMMDYILEWEIATACDTSRDEVQIAFGFTPFQECGDTLSDLRDGQQYPTVQIGDKCWMAKNLGWLPIVNPSYDGSEDDPFYYVYGYQGNDVGDAKATENYQKYGTLYNFPASLNVCPEGWHLPSDEEWKILEGTVDSLYGIGNTVWNSYGWRGYDVGVNLKSQNSDFENWHGTDQYNFNALPGGQRSGSGNFTAIGDYCGWWSSYDNYYFAGLRHLNFDHDLSNRNNVDKSIGLSVRCVRSISENLPPELPSNPMPENGSSNIQVDINLSWSCSDPENDPITYELFFGTEQNPPLLVSGITDTTYYVGTLVHGTTYYWQIIAKDNQINTSVGDVWYFITNNNANWQCGDTLIDLRDDKKYSTVQIGYQCWMAENLNVGEKIDGIEYPSDNGVIEKYCYENESTNCDVYGGLYIWHEMMEYTTSVINRGICPDGWHIPSDGDFCTLSTFVDPSVNCQEYGYTGTSAGGNLKTTGTIQDSTGLWNAPNAGATNEFGFTGLPSGGRTHIESFYEKGNRGFFWVTKFDSPTNQWYWMLSNERQDIKRYYFSIPGYGLSVRCVKD